ncbi:MAG TPA: M28 family peptidase, partial [Puia sp.]
ITAEDLKKHLFIVASADFEGRETATEGQRKAAAYIENDFRTLGLKPGNGDNFQLQYPVFQDSLETAALSVNGQSFEFNKDFFVPVALDYTAEMGAADIVFAGYGVSDGTRDDYKDLNVKGKIVMVLGGNPPGTQMPAGRAARRFFLAKQEAAQKNGAAALLILQSAAPRNGREPKGNMSMTEFPRTLYPNTFYITDAVARAIAGNDLAAVQNAGALGKTFAAGVKLGVKKTTLHLQSSDVLGFLEGTDLKDQILVISAHYDHLGKKGDVIWYGADDDGSGTVSVLELAEAFAKAKAAGKGPRRSVLFLANSGEEKGLFGSQYYSEHPTYPLEKTTADLNIDMIGRIDPNRKIGDSTNYVYVVGSDKLSTELKPLSEGNNKKYSKLELDYKFDDANDPEMIYYRSDHYNFARKGVPIIFYFDGIHKDYHQPSDTPDKINYDIMEKRARLVFFTAWEMANRNEMMKRDIALPAMSR